jgi:hypothetical protein
MLRKKSMKKASMAITKEEKREAVIFAVFSNTSYFSNLSRAAR